MDEFNRKNVSKYFLFLTQEEISAKNFIQNRLDNLLDSSPSGLSSRLTDSKELHRPRGHLSTSIQSCGENQPHRDDQIDVKKNPRRCSTHRENSKIYCTSNFDELNTNSFGGKKIIDPLTSSKPGHRKSVSEFKSKRNGEREDGGKPRRMFKSVSSDGVDFLNGNSIGFKSILEVEIAVKNSPASPVCEMKTMKDTFLGDYQTTTTVAKEKNDADMPEPKTETTCDDVEVDLDLGEPSDEVMEYARRELGETEEVKCVTLQELRDMIYERGDCTPHRMDDAFLIRFLRARRFNVDRAHRLVVNYCNFKEDYPDIHRNVNPFDMRFIADDDIITVPAYRTQCGRRMMIYRLGKWDPRKYPIEEIFKATVIVLELGILEPIAQIMGGIVIFDFEGLNMAHVWSITPQIASMVISLMISAFPMKTYAIHILHQSWVVDAMISVFKPLIDSRMLNKLFFHGSDMESLHRHVSPESLPKKYGGIQCEFPYDKWVDSLTKRPVIVDEMKQLGYIVPEEVKNRLKYLSRESS